MGAVKSFRNFMNKPSGERLSNANGQEAIDQHALLQADNERKAQRDYADRLQAIGSPLALAASRGLGLENPNKSADAIVFEEPVESDDSAGIAGELEDAEQSTDVNVYSIPNSSDEVEDSEHKLVA